MKETDTGEDKRNKMKDIPLLPIYEQASKPPTTSQPSLTMTPSQSSPPPTRTGQEAQKSAPGCRNSSSSSNSSSNGRRKQSGERRRGDDTCGWTDGRGGWLGLRAAGEQPGGFMASWGRISSEDEGGKRDGGLSVLVSVSVSQRGVLSG